MTLHMHNYGFQETGYRKIRPLGRWVLVAALSCVTGIAAAKPNVVIIYADDVGFADVGVNGGEAIPTPNIDALAKAGLNFTDGHSSASTCTPSRFSLLTGVHAYRKNVNIAAPNEPLLIDPDSLTLADLFKKEGYKTGIIGKWHLGLGTKEDGPDWNGELKPGPLELGFDSAFLLPTTNDRVPCVYVDGHSVIGLDPADPIYVGDKLAEVQKQGSTQYPDARANPKALFYESIVNGIGRHGYMSGGKAALWDDYTMADVFVGQAKKFVAENKDEPFFLFFSSQDIHIPNAPNERFKGKTKLWARGDAMVQFDWAVGEILAALEEHGLTENTLVIFSSDNGPTHHDDEYESTKEVSMYSPNTRNGHDASGKWRGGKYEIYEGGTRVPLIIRWPEKVEPGTSAALVNQIDFLASFAELLGVELAPDEARDSRNMLPAFLGEDRKGLEFMLEESRGVALREGDWKYIPVKTEKWAPGFAPKVDSLFNLADDPGEQKNVISEYPERAAQMAERLKKAKASQGVRKFAAGE
ncbi:MAG: sulfatase family protein [Luteolibacter sp.]